MKSPAIHLLAAPLLATLALPLSAEGIEPGMLLPPGTLHSLDGEEHAVSELRAGAKLTAIVFWATWSGSSLEEIESLRRLEELYAKGLRVLLVNVDGEVLNTDQRRLVEHVAADFPPSFTVLRDEGLAMFREYGIFGVPSTIVADANGMVTFRLPGFPVAGGAKMLSYIENTIHDRPALAGPWAYRPNPRAVRYFHLARILLRKGDAEMALHTLNRAVELDGEYTAPLELLGDLEMDEGRFEEALGYYDRALRYNPDATSLLASSAQCLALTGKVEEGLTRARGAIEQDPGNARAHARLAFTLTVGQRFDDARASFRRATELAPHDPKLFELQGQAFERLEMTEKAIEAYWRAFDLIQSASDPDLAVVPATSGARPPRGPGAGR